MTLATRIADAIGGWGYLHQSEDPVTAILSIFVVMVVVLLVLRAAVEGISR